jgi:hypothetical protein
MILYRVGGTCWVTDQATQSFTLLYLPTSLVGITSYNRSVTNGSLTNCVDHSLFLSTLLTVDYFRWRPTIHCRLSALVSSLAHNWLTRLSLSLMLRPTVSRPVCLGIKHPSWACDQIFISVRNTEYVWQLRSWFHGAPSLTRGQVCLLYVPLALARAVFLGS